MSSERFYQSSAVDSWLLSSVAIHVYHDHLCSCRWKHLLQTSGQLALRLLLTLWTWSARCSQSFPPGSKGYSFLPSIWEQRPQPPSIFVCISEPVQSLKERIKVFSISAFSQNVFCTVLVFLDALQIKIPWSSQFEEMLPKFMLGLGDVEAGSTVMNESSSVWTLADHGVRWDQRGARVDSASSQSLRAWHSLESWRGGRWKDLSSFYPGYGRLVKSLRTSDKKKLYGPMDGPILSQCIWLLIPISALGNTNLSLTEGFLCLLPFHPLHTDPVPGHRVVTAKLFQFWAFHTCHHYFSCCQCCMIVFWIPVCLSLC